VQNNKTIKIVKTLKVGRTYSIYNLDQEKN